MTSELRGSSMQVSPHHQKCLYKLSLIKLFELHLQDASKDLFISVRLQIGELRLSL